MNRVNEILIRRFKEEKEKVIQDLARYESFERLAKFDGLTIYGPELSALTHLRDHYQKLIETLERGFMI